MVIAIISDIHDNLVNLRKCLAWCEKNAVEKIICCGDITNSETLGILSAEFAGKIYLVRGNLEIYQEKEINQYKNYTYGGRTAVWEIAGKKIGVCHEPFLIKEVFSKREFPSGGGVSAADEVGFRNRQIDLVFYGHTHRPWIELKNGVQIVNPGTLGGVFTPATFAVWDTASGKLELKPLQNL
ncbi:MAG TPA: YfcE family phosphodiesterase [Candidatus Methylomirabilis sp.]|nr:YfcE family phosphodiesterase [Candidatus Methylomirabilis sp.]